MNSLKKCNIDLNYEEVATLVFVFGDVLNEFQPGGYNGRNFTNPIMATAFNKVFSALFERNHPCFENNFSRYMDSFSSIKNKERFEFIGRQLKVAKENVPTLNITLKMEGKEKNISFNSEEQMYLEEELKNIINYKLKPDAIQVVKKFYDAIENGETVQIDSSDDYAKHTIRR